MHSSKSDMASLTRGDESHIKGARMGRAFCGSSIGAEDVAASSDDKCSGRRGVDSK